MKRGNRLFGVLLVAIAMLLWVDLVDRPSSAVHMALEMAAALAAATAFVWFVVDRVRQALT